MNTEITPVFHEKPTFGLGNKTNRREIERINICTKKKPYVFI